MLLGDASGLADAEACSGFSRLGPVVQGLACALGLFLVSTLGPVGPSLFLYFKF